MALDTQIQKIRSAFPVLDQRHNGKRLIYLDSAAKSLTPCQATKEMVRYHQEVAATIHRGKHFLSDEASTHYENVRSAIAQFIGARNEEVVFVRNTTEALNTLAFGLKLHQDDLVVVTGDAHHSNLLPWRTFARTVIVRTAADGSVDTDHFEDLMRLKPKVVALTHCSNVTGIYSPVSRLAALAHSVGAIVVCDSAQYAPHRRIRVRELGVDALAFSMHKMLGPTGVGIMYASSELLDKLQPMIVGGGTVDWVDVDSHRFRKLPNRFEAGTPNIDGVYGAGAALSMLQDLGFDFLAEHERQLTSLMLMEAKKRSYIRVLGADAPDRAAIASMVITNVPSLAEFARSLSDAYGIMCRTGHLCAQPLVDRLAGQSVLRYSAYIYNTSQDILDGFAALDEVYRYMADTKRRGS